MYNIIFQLNSELALHRFFEIFILFLLLSLILHFRENLYAYSSSLINFFQPMNNGKLNKERNLQEKKFNISRLKIEIVTSEITTNIFIKKSEKRKKIY